MAQLKDTIIDGNLQVTGNISVDTPVDLEFGGTNVKTAADARKQILGYEPSLIRLQKSSEANTTVKTSVNYFKVSYGTSWTVDKYGSNFSSLTKNFTWNSGTSTATGIQISANAPAGYIHVFGDVRYLKSTTTSSAIQTYIVRDRGGTASTLGLVCGTYNISSSERITHSFDQIVYVEPGDFIFIGGYKGVASVALEIVTGNYTRWGAEWIANA